MMFILNKFLAWLGIAIAALSTVFCPFINIPIAGNWNMYQTDIRLFVITNGMLALLLIFLFLRKVTLFRYIAVVFSVWCMLAFAAVYFKISNYFGMKIFDGILAKTLDIKWGWFFLFLGAVVLLLSVRKTKQLN